MTESVPCDAPVAAGRPLARWYRWLVLGAMSFVCFAQYYIYDSITPLGTVIKEQLGFSGASYGLLFSAYAVANVFLLMLLIAGVLVDKLGLKLSGILYAALCVIGAGLTALGSMKQLPDFGPRLRLARAHLSRRLESRTQGDAPRTGHLRRGRGGDPRRQQQGARPLVLGKRTGLRLWREPDHHAPGDISAQPAGSVAEGWAVGKALWFAAAIMALGLGSFFFYLGLERWARGHGGAPGGSGVAVPEEKFRLREAFSFSPSFWLITFLCLAFYSAVFPFQSYAPNILVQKFGYSESRAGTFTSAHSFWHHDLHAHLRLSRRSARQTSDTHDPGRAPAGALRRCPGLDARIPPEFPFLPSASRSLSCRRPCGRPSQ